MTKTEWRNYYGLKRILLARVTTIFNVLVTFLKIEKLVVFSDSHCKVQTPKLVDVKINFSV